MLESFDKAYREADPKVMAVIVSTLLYDLVRYSVFSRQRLIFYFCLLKHCAKALLEFNGGHSCVQIYVNQHDFFMLHSKVNESTPMEGPNQYIAT